MKARFWLLSISGLLIINLAWVWRVDQNSTEYTQRMNENRNRFIQANKELYLMNRGWEFSMRSNDRKLPEDINTQAGNGPALNLDNYIGSSRKLILVLSDNHCSTCVDQLLFTVKNEIKELYRKDILVLFSVSGATHDQWDYRQKILSGVKFLEVRDKCLNLPIDSLEIPYFFMAGPERIANMAYIPYPSLEVQTKEYLNLVETRFFN